MVGDHVTSCSQKRLDTYCPLTWPAVFQMVLPKKVDEFRNRYVKTINGIGQEEIENDYKLAFSLIWNIVKTHFCICLQYSRSILSLYFVVINFLLSLFLFPSLLLLLLLFLIIVVVPRLRVLKERCFRDQFFYLQHFQTLS